MEINFKGKRALVTGAGQGIGKDIAIGLLKCGAKVLALDKSEESLNDLKKEFPRIEVVSVDLMDWKATKCAVEKCGDIDLLVNNAGITIIQSIDDVTEDAIDKILAINVKAPLNITQVVTKDMKKRGKGGAIVNLSSQCGQIALLEHVVYCASKGAINMATKVMALELGPYQIRANAVAPTVVNTEMGRVVWKEEAKSAPMKARIPLGKFAETHHIVDTVLFLLSEQAEMINGVVLAVDGGVTAC